MIDITPTDLEIVKSILEKHLPQDTEVYVFGSRAKNQARKFSDLDLALDAHQPLSLHTLADLASDFEESDLPYKVDLIDWLKISSSFKAAIESQRVKLLKV